MQSFMKANNISSGQLAVTRNGKLLLAHGYTYNADSSVSVTPTSMFRVASISKPITATAVLKLVEEGKLNLSDRVTTLLSLDPPPPPSGYPSLNLNDVTVLHLLQHLGGWDWSRTWDPLFHDWATAGSGPLPISQADIIRYTTANQPLSYAPGSTYFYSNYGYLLLGRIIEARSGKSYSDYVREKVFVPRGIPASRMVRGRSLTQHPAEVHYDSGLTGSTVYDKTLVNGQARQVPRPYGAWNLENHDANGGWVTTAVDLTRFAAVYDPLIYNNPAKRVLSPQSVATAFARPAGGAGVSRSDATQSSAWYGCGWSVREYDAGGRNIWHEGALDGTSSTLVRRKDGVAYAALINRRYESVPDNASGAWAGAMDDMLYNVADSIQVWPDYDLSYLFPST
jgi:CubicO group peptidase (beta-lactamase class C family)